MSIQDTKYTTMKKYFEEDIKQQKLIIDIAERNIDHKKSSIEYKVGFAAGIVYANEKALRMIDE